jgi:2-iminobutanoate/2-iminopropanoate deaminase
LTKRSVYVETSPKPSGHYSQCIVANGFVYLAGVGPYDPVTRAVVGKTIENQTAQVLRNVDAVLAGAGCRLTDVVNCTVELSVVAALEA